MSITTKQFLREYKEYVEFAGGYPNAAKVFGVTPEFARYVGHGVKLPGDKILEAMGFMPQKTVKNIMYRYERKS